jgi:hypothetical protein
MGAVIIDVVVDGRVEGLYELVCGKLTLFDIKGVGDGTCLTTLNK